MPPLGEGPCSTLTGGQGSYKQSAENDLQIHEKYSIFKKQLTEELLIKQQTTKDKSFQSLVCAMQMPKNSRGECLYKYILGLFRKTNRKSLQFNISITLLKETKTQNKIYLNSKKKQKFTLIKP